MTLSSTPFITPDILARLRVALTDAKEWSHDHAVVTATDLRTLLTLVEAPPTLTVGAALADSRLCVPPRMVAEHQTMHGAWAQTAYGPSHRIFGGGGWGPWIDGVLSMASLARPCRFVPLAYADRDPTIGMASVDAVLAMVGAPRPARCSSAMTTLVDAALARYLWAASGGHVASEVKAANDAIDALCDAIATLEGSGVPSPSPA